MKLVLIHGAGNRKEVWDDFVSCLPPEIDVVALELPGHGENEGEGFTSIEDYASWVADYIRENGLEPVVVAGHSMGGAVALTLLSKEPSLLKGGVLISTGARLKVNPQILEGLKSDYVGTIRKIAPWTVARGAPQDVMDRVVEIFSSCKPEVAYGDFVACDNFDGREYAQNIKLPVLIVVGDKDMMTPVKLSEELNRLIPNSELKVVESAGHMIQLEKPEKLASVVVDFLKKL